MFIQWKEISFKYVDLKLAFMEQKIIFDYIATSADTSYLNSSPSHFRRRKGAYLLWRLQQTGPQTVSASRRGSRQASSFPCAVSQKTLACWAPLKSFTASPHHQYPLDLPFSISGRSPRQWNAASRGPRGRCDSSLQQKHNSFTHLFRSAVFSQLGVRWGQTTWGLLRAGFCLQEPGSRRLLKAIPTPNRLPPQTLMLMTGLAQSTAANAYVHAQTRRSKQKHDWIF